WPLCRSRDGRFACGPVFQRGQASHGRFGRVLKEEGRPSGSDAFVGRAKRPPEEKLQERLVNPREVNRSLRRVAGIPAGASKGRAPLRNVLELQEPKPEAGQPNTTRVRWLTDLAINRGNLRQLAQKAGRDRGKIEPQGVHSQQQGGFVLEHRSRHDSRSAKGFEFRLPMAPLFFQRRGARKRGKKKFPPGLRFVTEFAQRPSRDLAARLLSR